MELIQSISGRFQKRFRKLAWLSEYGDLVMLVLLFLVLLYTITWASDKNIYRGVDFLVKNGYNELKTFCAEELTPEDYTLERRDTEILLHLPTDRWFEKDGARIKSEKRIPLERLARKISALRLFSLPDNQISQAVLTPRQGQDETMHIQLKIANMSEKNTRQFPGRTDDLFRARASELSQMLNASMSVKDYWFELEDSDHPFDFTSLDNSGSAQMLRKNELTMLISASLTKN